MVVKWGGKIEHVKITVYFISHFYSSLLNPLTHICSLTQQESSEVIESNCLGVTLFTSRKQSRHLLPKEQRGASLKGSKKEHLKGAQSRGI